MDSSYRSIDFQGKGPFRRPLKKKGGAGRIVGRVIGVVLAAPVLLYAVGAILGLIVVWLKNVTFGRGVRMAFRIVSALMIALFALSIIPVFLPDTGSALMGPVVVVFYVSRLAPVFIVLLGFLYPLALAPLDKSKRRAFAKYLPDDHFE